MANIALVGVASLLLALVINIWPELFIFQKDTGSYPDWIRWLPYPLSLTGGHIVMLAALVPLLWSRSFVNLMKNTIGVIVLALIIAIPLLIVRDHLHPTMASINNLLYWSLPVMFFPTTIFLINVKIIYEHWKKRSEEFGTENP